MRALFLLAASFAGTAAFGQSPADRITPLLSDGAIAVVRIDLARVTADSAVRELQPYLSFDVAGGGSTVRAVLQAAQAAGGEELFVVLDIVDVHGHPLYLVVPDAEPQPFEKVPFESKTLLNGNLIAGSKRLVESLQAGNANSERPGLAEAFAAVADSPVQAVFVPSLDQRRVLRELLPDLPDDLGGATGQQLSEGIQWGSFGLALAPQLRAQVVIQSDSEEAATRFKTVVESSLRHFAQLPQVLEANPSLPAFAKTLTFQQEGERLRLATDESLESVVKLLSDLAERARQITARKASLNNLKQIALALHNFHDRYGSFPPNASYDGDTSLLSWRVFVLPFLGEQELYEQFRLNEPWDSEHNRPLIEKMPEVFQSPSIATPAGHTVFLVPMGSGMAFEGRAGVPIKEFSDGTSNTILVVEATAEHAVPWTKPADLTIDQQQPLADLTRARESFAVLFADGSALHLSSKNDPKVLLKILTRGGSEIIGSGEILH